MKQIKSFPSALSFRLALLFIISCVSLTASGQKPTNSSSFSPTRAQVEKTPAFPGAEGFGRYVTGGRGGSVYHVTNLNDSGDGSLRWALGKSGTKTIVFDVSGTIHLKSALQIGSNTTIAGQTAPGDGICLADYPCTIKGNNVIVRYMRFRLGNINVKQNGADGWDAFGGFDQRDWMIDHCSVSWSIDECLSVLGNHNTTVQWCLVAQSLVNAGHSKGAHGYGGNWGGSGASFHHNLLVHHGSRTPRLGPRPTTQLDERMDMRNNVIYNYGGNGCYGGEGMTVNIVNNYYKPGPGTPSGSSSRELKAKRIAGIGIRTNSYVTQYPDYAPALHLWGKYYVTGNVNSKYADVTADNWNIGILQQIDAGGCDGTFTQATQDSIRLWEPMPFVYTTTHTAEQAYHLVLDYAGASLHRDSFDELMISDTRNSKASHTGSGLDAGFINSQDDNRPSNADDTWSAWPTLNSTEAPADNDGDGMPDDWEAANGLNPADPADGRLYDEDGYTHLEHYLNAIVADITDAQYEGGEPQGDIQTRPGGGESDETGMIVDGSGTVLWAFDTGTDGQYATYSDDIATFMGTNDVIVGDGLSYAGKKNINGKAFTMFQPAQKENAANDGNAVAFRFTPSDGHFFRPTKIEMKISRIGTDGGSVDIAWQNANGTTTLESELVPNRNNADGGYFTSFSRDITGITSAAGVSAVIVNIYRLNDNKQVAFADVTITGQVLSADTGIESLTTHLLPLTSDYYSLSGQRLSAPSRGISIQVNTLPDGKRQARKVIMR